MVHGMILHIVAYSVLYKNLGTVPSVSYLLQSYVIGQVPIIGPLCTFIV